MFEITEYQTDEGRKPYSDWFASLEDLIAAARIDARLNRLSAGLFGDCKPVGNGVWELRIDHGPGYRVYYAQSGKHVVLLLIGGSKRTQRADIRIAADYWKDYQERTS